MANNPSAVFGVPSAFLTKIQDLEVDVVLNETHQFQTLITENPVEDGSPITDHIVNLPVKLEFQCRFTDTPLGFLASLAAGAGGLTAQTLGASDVASGIAAASSAAAVGALLGELRPGLAKTKFELLVLIQSQRDVITFVTGITTYENMAIESLVAVRSPGDGKSVRFNITLKEILKAGDTAQSNRERILDDVIASAFSPPEALGIVQKSLLTGV